MITMMVAFWSVLVDLHQVKEIQQRNEDHEDEDEYTDATISNFPLSSSSLWWLIVNVGFFLWLSLCWLVLTINCRTTFQQLSYNLKLLL